MPSEHTLSRSSIRHDWDNSYAPALVVGSGDVVHFDLLMAGEGQVFEHSRAADVAWDFDTIYNLAGPIHVEGALPGDSLEIEILSLTPGEWGWTAILPNLGLLADEFPDPYLRLWDLRNGTVASLGSKVRVPIAPFLGTMGVALDEPGRFSPFPPHKGGGNLDTRHLVAGSTLWLPVFCEGALFSCGDPHASQGDGEVCVSAIECSMQASLRLTIRRHTITAPRFRAPRDGERQQSGSNIGTMGIDADLMEGARHAVRAMIDWIVVEHGLSREDAYILTSVAGDLHIHEIVDAGVWNVGMTTPLDIFD